MAINRFTIIMCHLFDKKSSSELDGIFQHLIDHEDEITDVKFSHSWVDLKCGSASYRFWAGTYSGFLHDGRVYDTIKEENIYSWNGPMPSRKTMLKFLPVFKRLRKAAKLAKQNKDNDKINHIRETLEKTVDKKHTTWAALQHHKPK